MIRIGTLAKTSELPPAYVAAHNRPYYEIINLASLHLGLKPQFVHVRDDSYGKKVNGNWTGAVRDLLDGHIDATMPFWVPMEEFEGVGFPYSVFLVLCSVFPCSFLAGGVLKLLRFSPSR